VPPRFAFWTILIDDRPTAFRARDQAELLPTLNQLRRTNPNARLKWFARGKLWDSPEQARWAATHAPRRAQHRGRDWRPGGEHKDPRARSSAPSGKRTSSSGKTPRRNAPRAADHPLRARPRRPWRKKPKPSE
jgi:hypothetical protein